MPIFISKQKQHTLWRIQLQRYSIVWPVCLQTAAAARSSLHSISIYRYRSSHHCLRPPRPHYHVEMSQRLLCTASTENIVLFTSQHMSHSYSWLCWFHLQHNMYLFIEQVLHMSRPSDPITTQWPHIGTSSCSLCLRGRCKVVPISLSLRDHLKVSQRDSWTTMWATFGPCFSSAGWKAKVQLTKGPVGCTREVTGAIILAYWCLCVLPLHTVCVWFVSSTLLQHRVCHPVLLKTTEARPADSAALCHLQCFCSIPLSALQKSPH